MAAIPFEMFCMGLEPLRGEETTNWRIVPVTDGGILKPAQDIYRPEESVGLLTNNFRSVPKKRWGEWEFDAVLDVYMIRYLLAMALGYPPVVVSGKSFTDAEAEFESLDAFNDNLELLDIDADAGANVGADATIRVERFYRELRRDTLKSASIAWGDPETEIFKSLYAMADELTIAYDATGDEGATVSMSGMCQYPSRIGQNPDILQDLQLDLAPLMPAFDVWIDPVTKPYGTTKVTDQVLSFETKIETGVGYKYYGRAHPNYQRTDRGRTHPETSLNIEFLTPEFYRIFDKNSSLRVRLRLMSNQKIPGSNKRYMMLIDFLANVDFDSWGDHENTRTTELTLHHAWDNDIKSDLRVTVRSDKTTPLE